MLTLPSSVRVYLALDPVSMHLDPRWSRLIGWPAWSGRWGSTRRPDIWSRGGAVFINRPATHMKVLFMMVRHTRRSGFTLLYHRLERGTFHVPRAGADGARRELTPAELGLILEGVDLNQRERGGALSPCAPWAASKLISREGNFEDLFSKGGFFR